MRKLKNVLKEMLTKGIKEKIKDAKKAKEDKHIFKDNEIKTFEGGENKLDNDNHNDSKPIFKDNEIVESSDPRLAEIPKSLKGVLTPVCAHVTTHSKRVVLVKDGNIIKIEYITFDDVCDTNSEYSEYFDTLYISPNNQFAIVLVPSYIGKPIFNPKSAIVLSDIKKLNITQKLNHYHNGDCTVAIITK